MNSLCQPKSSLNQPQQSRSSRLFGDLRGGIVSALVGLPLSLACGAMLFQKIGGDLASYGMTAAIYSAIITGLISALIGCHQLQISGPRVATTLILASFLSTVYLDLETTLAPEMLYGALISLMAACVILSGLLQLLMAWLNLGNFIKYIPLSVGNGVSISIGAIILVKQVPVLLAVTESQVGALTLTERWQHSPKALLMVAAITVMLLFLKPLWQRFGFGTAKWLDYMPLIAPAAGVLAFYSLFPMHTAGLLIGDVSSDWPALSDSLLQLVQSLPLLLTYSQELVLTALAIALMGSLSSLLSANILDRSVPSQHQATSRELAGQGLGNLLSGIVGGMPGAGSEARGRSNLNAGGNSRISGLIHALIVFLLVGVASPLLSLLPQVVLSALLIHTALTMAKPLADLTIRFSRNCKERPWVQILACVKDIVQALAVILVMLPVAFLWGVTASIGVGFTIAALIFLREMVRNTKLRILSGNIHHSRRVRYETAMQCLQSHGDQIKILELHGAIFFGTAERLKEQIIKLAQTSRWLIIDFRQVTEMDITGAEVIGHVIKMQPTIQFSFSHVYEGDDCFQALCSAGLTSVEGTRRFDTTDLALEQAEHQLLDLHNIPRLLVTQTLDVADFPLVKDLDSSLMEVLSEYLQQQQFEPGEALFTDSEPGEKLYFLRQGCVSITMKPPLEAALNTEVAATVRPLGPEANALRRRRRVTFSPGVVIGEMAFFEQRQHSVSAFADDTVSVYILNRSSLTQIVQEHPSLAQHLMFGLCRHLSTRLREVTQEVQMLEQ